MLDAILNDVRRRCEKEKIMFSCIVNCKDIDFIDVVDLGVLMGNMLDNAIEAAVKLPEENRVVDLKLNTDEHYFRIVEKNTFAGNLQITQDGIASTKPEDGYENRVNNAAALGYTEAEVRAAQDLVNVVVAKANAEKAEAETALTVITAAYDVIAGKYGDGDARRVALIEAYSEELQGLIQAKVDTLLNG